MVFAVFFRRREYRVRFLGNVGRSLAWLVRGYLGQAKYTPKLAHSGMMLDDERRNHDTGNHQLSCLIVSSSSYSNHDTKYQFDLNRRIRYLLNSNLMFYSWVPDSHWISISPQRRLSRWSPPLSRTPSSCQPWSVAWSTCRICTGPGLIEWLGSGHSGAIFRLSLPCSV